MSNPFTLTLESRAVLDVLDALLKRGQDMRPVYSAIGQEMENRVRARFETKADPAGEPWAPWRPRTVKQYDKADTVKGRGRRPDRVVRSGSLLERSGHMLGSLSYQVDGEGVRIGFGMPYALYHETGTTRMARRGLLADDDSTLGDADERAILDLVGAYFAEAV